MKGRLPGILICLALFAAALGLRLHYVNSAVVLTPVTGDAKQYVAYADNLREHGVFGIEPGQPDAFRTPGYPLLIAAVKSVAGEGWYRAMLWVQAFLGALFAPIAYVTARAWLSRRFSTVAGGAAALFPHMILVNGYLLSEPLYGLFVCSAVALLLWRHVLASGAMFAAAYLVNPVVLPAAILCGLLAGSKRAAILFLAVFLAVPLGWGLRNAVVDLPDGQGSESRALVNFVQGSWPNYHEAHYGFLKSDIESAMVFAQIKMEQELMVEDPSAGMRSVANRLSQEPARYLVWYALQKPAKLWSWPMGIADSDVTIYETVYSPFHTSAAWQMLASLSKTITPILGALMLAFVVGAAWQRDRELLVVAAVLVSVTAVHVVLQAEPRYAIPYRPLQFVAVATALAWIVSAVQRVRARQAVPAA